MVPIIRRRSEQGDTLIEVLLALVVLSLASVSLIVGFGTIISASAEHRTSSDENLALQSLTQSFISQIQSNSGYFAYACSNYSSISQYPGTSNTQGGSNFGLSVTEDNNTYYGNYAVVNPIQYWNTTSASFGTTCYANQPQLITIQLWGPNVVGTARTLSFVVTNPLGTSTVASGTNTPYSLVITNPLTNSLAGAAGSTPSSLTTPPTAGQAGLATTGSWQPIVQIVDSKGNTVSTDLSPVFISVYGNATYSSATGTGSISGCTGTENNGFVAFTGCAISSAGTYFVQATDLNSSINSSSFYEVTISAAGNSLTFSKPSSATSGGVSGTNSQPSAGASGATMTTQPQVWVINSSGQQVAGWTGTISLASTGGVLTTGSGTCLTLSVTNGYAAATGCKFAGAYTLGSQGQYLAAQYEVIATSSGVVSAYSSAFGVTGYGTATTVAYYTQPIGVAAGSTASPAPGTALATQSVTIPNLTTANVQAVVVLQDSFGNVVESDKNSSGTTVGLTFAMSSGETQSGCVATPATSTYLATSGYLLITGCKGSAYLNNVTLTATASPATGLTTASTISSTFNITYLPTTSGLVFSTQPVAGASGSNFTTMPVLQILDPAGNLVTASNGASVTLTATPTSAVTGVGLSTCTNLITSEGIVNVQNCSFSGLESTNYYLNAAITFGSVNLTATSTAFSPTGPGPATQLVFTTQPVGAAADSSLSTMPVIWVEDLAGNLVTTSTAIISLTSSSGTLANCSNLVATAGIANVTGCTLGGTIGSGYTLIASATGLSSATSNPLSVTGPGSISQIALNLAVSGSSCTPSIAFNGTCTVSGSYEDTYGNVETAISAPISFVLTGVGTVSVTNFAQANGVASETLTGTGIGQVNVQTTGDGFSSTGSFNVSKAPQTVNFYTNGTYATTTTTGTATYSSGGTYQTYAQGSQGGTITFASTTTGVCTVNSGSGLITFVTAGSCVITADAATTTNYADSGTTNFTLTIGKGNQAITYSSTAPTRTRVGGPTYTPVASATSGLTVTISLDGTSTGCTLSGGVVSFTGAGTCVIDANQGGNGSWNAATQVQQSITVVNLGFTSLATAATATNTATTVSITGTAGSKLVIYVSFTSNVGGNTCGTPTSTAFTGATQIGTTYGFYAGNPYDYECVYTATATGTAGTVTETDTGTASNGHAPSTTLQVMGITGDNSAVVTNSATNGGSSTAPTFKLGATPGTTSLELAFGAAQFTQGGTQPTFSTPTNFTLLSIQPATGYPSIVGYVFYGTAAASVTDTLNPTNNWGTIGLEIQP